MNIGVIVVTLCVLVNNTSINSSGEDSPQTLLLSDRARALLREDKKSVSPNASSKPSAGESSPLQTHASPDQNAAALDPSETQSPRDDPESEKVRLEKAIKNKLKKEKKRRRKAEAASSTTSSTPGILNSGAEGLPAEPPQHIETCTSKPEADAQAEQEPYNKAIAGLAQGIISLANKNALDTQEKYTGVVHLAAADLPEFLRRYDEGNRKIEGHQKAETSWRNEVGSSASRGGLRGKSTHQLDSYYPGGDAFSPGLGRIESMMRQNYPGVTYLRASDLPAFLQQAKEERNQTGGEEKREASNENESLEASSREGQQKEATVKSSSKKRRKKKKKEKNPETLGILKASSQTDDDEPEGSNEQITQFNDSMQDVEDLSWSNTSRDPYLVEESSIFNHDPQLEVISENASTLPFEPNSKVKIESPSKTFESPGTKPDHLLQLLTMENENAPSLKEKIDDKQNSEDALSRSEEKREEERTSMSELPSQHPLVSAKTVYGKDESFAEVKYTKSPEEKEDGEEEKIPESELPSEYQSEHPSVFAKTMDEKEESFPQVEESTKPPEEKEGEEERTPENELPSEHSLMSTKKGNEKQESFAEEKSTESQGAEEKLSPPRVVSHKEDKKVNLESDPAKSQDSPVPKEVVPKLEHREKIRSRSFFEKAILSTSRKPLPSQMRKDGVFYFQGQFAGDSNMSLDDETLLTDYSGANSLHPSYMSNAEEDYNDESSSNGVWQSDLIEECSPAASPLEPLRVSIPIPGESDGGDDDDDDNDDAFSFSTSPTYLDSVNEVIHLHRLFNAPQAAATPSAPQVPHLETMSNLSTPQQPYQPPTLRTNFAKSPEQKEWTGSTPNANKNFRQASTSSTQMNSAAQQKGHTTAPVSEPVHASPKVKPKCSESSISLVKNQIILGAIRQSARQSVRAVLPSFHRKTLEMADKRIRDALNRVFTSAESEAGSSEQESQQLHEEKYNSEKYSTPSLPPPLNDIETKNESEDYTQDRRSGSARGDAPAIDEGEGETFSACYARVHNSAIVDASRLVGENKHVMLVTAKSKEIDVMEELRSLGVDSKLLETDRTSSYPASGNILVACDSPHEIEQLKNVIKSSSKLTVLV